LETATLPDGRNLGQVLHTEGHFKKVPTNQVFVTPDKINKIRLNDLNEMLSKIDQGGEALKKMEDLDKNKGMHRRTPDEVVTSENPTEASKQLTEQSQKLILTAESLLKEAKVLGEKASALLLVSPPTPRRRANRKTTTNS
jgi:hypothetical protein